MEEYPRTSIVVCTHNGIANGIESCLESLLKLDYPPERYELIVVDDGSNDDTAQCIHHYKHEYNKNHIPFIALAHAPSRGLYFSKCMGVKYTRNCEIIAVTDDDCEVHPGWLKHLVPHYEDPEVGSVGGRIDSKNNRTVLERFAADPWNNVLCNPANARFFHGANCSYRKSALLGAGSFNQKIKSGGDAEVSFRLREAGWKLAYDPEAIIYHQHRTTLKGIWQQFRKYGSGDYHLLQNFHDARFTPREIFWGEFGGACLELPSRMVTALGEEDSRLVLVTPFLNMFKSAAWFSGYLQEVFKQKQ